MPFNNDNYSVAHPALSLDGKKLYFASDMPGTTGESDLWYVDIYKDGSYGDPIIKNLENQTIIKDLIKENESHIICSGGIGGKGNVHFKSATQQTPRFSQEGTKGEFLSVELELKVLADVGLVGLPNAGKSTLLSVMTTAKPKIADYPFVSYLYYADRIYQINLAIAGIAIGVVILPQLSKHIIKKNKKKIDLIQNKALELSLFLSLPATIALLVGSNDIISALFGYGQFNESSVSNSANALFYFALGLPAFAFIKVFSNFFFANQDTKTPFYISLASVLLNILISIYFFRSIGFIIIPIATSISSWFNTIILFLILKKRSLFNFNSIFMNRFFKIILSSIFMGALFYYLLILFQYELAFDQTFKSFYLILSVVIAACFYIFVSYLMKAFQLEDIKLKY